jgi:hypothetical protein
MCMSSSSLGHALHGRLGTTLSTCYLTQPPLGCPQLRDRHVRSVSLQPEDIFQLLRVPTSRAFTTILHVRLDVDIATPQDMVTLSKGMWALVEAVPQLRSAELYVSVEHEARWAATAAAADCTCTISDGQHASLAAHAVASAPDAVAGCGRAQARGEGRGWLSQGTFRLQKHPYLWCAGVWENT